MIEELLQELETSFVSNKEVHAKLLDAHEKVSKQILFSTWRIDKYKTKLDELVQQEDALLAKMKNQTSSMTKD